MLEIPSQWSLRPISLTNLTTQLVTKSNEFLPIVLPGLLPFAHFLAHILATINGKSRWLSV